MINSWNRIRMGGSIVVLALCIGTPAVAQNAIVYPAKGQSAAQQEKDTGACKQWATTNTGVDPAVLAAQANTQVAVAAPPPPQVGGERVRGAVRGAAAGAVIGEIAGNDAGKGAAIGATTGVVVGGARQRQKVMAANQQQAAAEQSAAMQQQANQQQVAASLDTYNRAVSACLEGRGYVLK